MLLFVEGIKMKDLKDEVDKFGFFKTREFKLLLFAFIISLSIMGSFWYGGYTACDLGGGYYYRFACVDLTPIPVSVDVSSIDCSDPINKENYLYCNLDNLTINS